MESIEHLVLEQLRALRSDIVGLRSELHSEFKDVKARLNHIDSSLSGVRRDGALSAEDFSRQQVSIDSIVERIQRIEKRLELAN